MALPTCCSIPWSSSKNSACSSPRPAFTCSGSTASWPLVPGCAPKSSRARSWTVRLAGNQRHTRRRRSPRPLPPPGPDDSPGRPSSGGCSRSTSSWTRSAGAAAASSPSTPAARGCAISWTASASARLQTARRPRGALLSTPPCDRPPALPSGSAPPGAAALPRPLPYPASAPGRLLGLRWLPSHRGSGGGTAGNEVKVGASLARECPLGLPIRSRTSYPLCRGRRSTAARRPPSGSLSLGSPCRRRPTRAPAHPFQGRQHRLAGQRRTAPSSQLALATKWCID
jgi:hypothetical protein